jgi:hypothetical protein
MTENERRIHDNGVGRGVRRWAGGGDGPAVQGPERARV